ncbi:MAG: nuclease-related domain-containing protein [Marinilabilia sp.]
MGIWKQIIENDNMLLWTVVGIFLLITVIPLIKKIRDRKLLKSVTSLNRGTKTERDLILRLLKHGIPSQTLFHDLYIEKSNGEFSQIDVVLATSVGIIVFEIKDYSGWIFGNGNHSHWTKVLAYGRNKYRFYNPIKQNKNHIETLKGQLKQFKTIPFFSIIVFYGDCELKEINFVPEGTFLVKPLRINEVLKHIKENNEVAPYTNKKEIVRTLKEAVNNGENISNQEKHKANINDMLGKNRIFD